MVNHESRMLIGIGRCCGIEGLEIFTETKTVGWPAS